MNIFFYKTRTGVLYDALRIPESSHVGDERCAVANSTYLYEVFRGHLPDHIKHFEYNLTLDALEEVIKDGWVIISEPK